MFRTYWTSPTEIKSVWCESASKQPLRLGEDLPRWEQRSYILSILDDVSVCLEYPWSSTYSRRHVVQKSWQPCVSRWKRGNLVAIPLCEKRQEALVFTRREYTIAHKVRATHTNRSEKLKCGMIISSVCAGTISRKTHVQRPIDDISVASNI